MPERVLRIDEVKERTGQSKSSIYRGVAEGTFPRPIRLGQNMSGWLESEITAWIAERDAKGQCEHNHYRLKAYPAASGEINIL